MAIIRVKKWSATAAIVSMMAANIPMVPNNGLLDAQAQAGVAYRQIVEFHPAPSTHTYKTVIWPGREEMPIGPLVYFPDGEPDEVDEIQGCRYCIEGEPYPDWESLDDFELEMAMEDPYTCFEHGNTARHVWTPRNDAWGVHPNPGPGAIFFNQAFLYGH